MTVYVNADRVDLKLDDKWRPCPYTEPDVVKGHTHRGLYSKLWSDVPQELDEFAERLGLNPRWGRVEPDGTLYYLVTEEKRQRAIKLGAVEVRA